MSEGKRFRKRGVAGRIFEVKGDELGWCLNLPGLPGRPEGTPSVPFLQGLGFGVVQPQYAGSFDSDGSFDPAESWRTVVDTLALMSSGELVGVSRASFAVAHSFGTHVLVKAILNGADPGPKVALLSPMIEFGDRRGAAGIKVDLVTHSSNIASLMPHTYRLSAPDVLQQFFLGDGSYLPASPDNSSRRISVFLASGESDPSLDAQLALNATREKLVQMGNFSIAEEFVAPESGHSVAEMLENGLDDKLSTFLFS